MTQAGKGLYLVANWKSHKTWEETQVFLSTVDIPQSEHQVIICPPLPYVIPMHDAVLKSGLPVKIGVQDISPYPFGAYTGAVTGAMLTPAASYAIVGHSERRRYFHETNQEVSNKARISLENHITPIVCIDEPYLGSQLASFTEAELNAIIVAYEPLAAIGSGTPDTPEHADQVAQKMFELTRVEFPVLYGGSVAAATVKSFVSMPNISGVLVGGASLEPQSWSDLVKAGTA